MTTPTSPQMTLEPFDDEPISEQYSIFEQTLRNYNSSYKIESQISEPAVQDAIPNEGIKCVIDVRRGTDESKKQDESENKRKLVPLTILDDFPKP